MYRCTHTLIFLSKIPPFRLFSGRFFHILHNNFLFSIQWSNCPPLSPKRICRFDWVQNHRFSSSSKESIGIVEEEKNDGFVPGPPLQLGVGKMANLTHRSVFGSAGDTVILATVSREETLDSDEPFLTVEYKQRTAAIGKFPLNTRRNDSGRPSDSEILASRAIDRSLRPVFKANDVAHYHVEVVLQAASEKALPVVTALNCAVAALRSQLVEPVAATNITIMPDGTLLQEALHRPDAVGELLFVGTKNRVVMLEYTAITAPMPEDDLIRIMNFAHRSIQPYIATIEQLQEVSPCVSVDFEAEKTKIRAELGLSTLSTEESSTEHGESSNETDCSTAGHTSVARRDREELLNEIVAHCSSHLAGSIHKLFGFTSNRIVRESSPDIVYLHDGSKPLLTKTSRGLKEQVLHEEIKRLADEYCRDMLVEFISDDSDADQLTSLRERDRSWIHKEAVYRLFRQGLWETSFNHGTRADGRKGTKLGQGWKTIRPLSVTIPALPDCVHGSSAFARGDTQVLCTVTLGAPSDGQPNRDPFRPAFENDVVPEVDEDKEKLPIGSLRFLRTQEAMESDLNTRKIKADKERTGDSGVLAEVKRAFLQYDFPSYSTGTISKRKGGIDRRAIGHGSLAERAVLPTLPDKEAFPYSIRMTSEVTDSNGSSSMASVCGASLALLDAGVPVRDLVAGVSVGLITDAANDKPALLLDLTGTEDHYGNMDFKIAGTRSGVSAIQLDVKAPVELQTLGDALQLAQSGRTRIIDVMEHESRRTFKGHWRRIGPKKSAPRVEVVRFDPQRKRDLLGPGGIVVRQLEERYDVSIDLTQEGQCLLVGNDRELVQKAKTTVMDLVADVVEGEQYTGTVIEIKDFGAIVELLRNKEGLLHISELSMDNEDMANHPEGSFGFVSRQLEVGQTIEVLCIGVDPLQGTAKLSRKALLQRQLEEQRLNKVASKEGFAN